MTDSERDIKITEMHNDIRWIKEWTIDHKSTHSKYVYYMITVIVACILSWFR